MLIKHIYLLLIYFLLIDKIFDKINCCWNLFALRLNETSHEQKCEFNSRFCNMAMKKS